MNGQPGAMFLDQQDRLIAVMELDIVDDAIQSVRSVANPDKLRHLGPLSDILSSTRWPQLTKERES